MPTSRQQLAQILSFLFRERKFSVPYVASRCKVTVTDVQRWLEGVLVPNSGEWTDLQRYISKDMSTHTPIWQQAKIEEDEERRAMVRSLDRAHRVGGEKPSSNKATTNLGDKIKEAVKEPLAKPSKPPTETMIQLGQKPRGVAKDGRLLAPMRPTGSMSNSAHQERRQFVKGILLQRPNITGVGKDGLQALLRARFGIGIDPRIIPGIREEIAQEHRHATGAPERASETLTMPKPATSVIVTSHNPRDLQAGVELILGAVPGLQELTITVDDNGEASIDFKIRKVETGSLKVSTAKIHGLVR